MDIVCWVRATLIVLVLQLVYIGRMNGFSETEDDWKTVMTLGEVDGEGFEAIVQPLVEMAANSYRYPRVKPILGWTLIDAVAPIHGGMHATLYKENGDSKRLVLSFRGTDFSGDESSKADVCALDVIWIPKTGSSPIDKNCSRFSDETLDYYKQAVDYAEMVIRNHPDSSLLLTGHSLGAGLALLVTATLDVSPSLPVVAFSSPGVAKVLERKSIMLSSTQAKKLFIISDMWDEIMRTTWDDQVGTTCLYPTKTINECVECFDEAGATSTGKIEQPDSPLQNFISNEELKYSEKLLPDISDACWNCFLRTHILKHVMDLIALGVKPICEFHTVHPFDSSISPKQSYNC